MKKEELMIGDWVYNTHNQQAEQVQEIGSGLVMLDYNDLYEYDEIEPIPLTEEEAQAIVYHDGQYVEDNRSVATHEEKLTLLLQYADNWSGFVVEEE